MLIMLWLAELNKAFKLNISISTSCVSFQSELSGRDEHSEIVSQLFHPLYCLLCSEVTAEWGTSEEVGQPACG